MFERLPFKKDYLLIASTLVLLIISYRFAFKNSLEAWRTRKQLEAKIDSASNLSFQPEYLERKNANLDKVIKLYKEDTIEFRNNSINDIALIAEKQDVKLINAPVQDSPADSSKIVFEKFQLEGDYFSLIKTMNSLQSTENIGIVRSETLRNVKTYANELGAKKLVAEVCLEIIK